MAGLQRGRNRIILISAFAGIALVLMLLSPISLAIPSQHYFKSIDVRYNEASESIYYSLDNIGMIVAVSDGNALAVIIGRYAGANGAFYAVLYNISFDSVQKVVYFQNQTTSYTFHPTSAKIYGSYLIATLRDSNGYSYLINFSLPDLSVQWAKRTNASLLDTCLHDSTLYVVSDPPVSTGGVAILIVDPVTGELQGYSYKKHWLYYNIDRARMHCTPSGLIIVGHEADSKLFIETYDYSGQHYALLYGGIDFIVQELVYNPETNEIYAIGSGRYDDFNAGNYHQPVVLALSVPDALSGNDPLKWAVVLHPNEYADDHYAFLGGDLHTGSDGQWLGLVGMLEFEPATSDHAFFAVLNLSQTPRAITYMIEVPATLNSVYTRGGYLDLYEEGGYVWAFGFTWYAVGSENGDNYNVGVAFISNGINDTLTWFSRPEGVNWPDVKVTRYNSSSISQDYITSFEEPQAGYLADGTIDNLEWNSISITGTDITDSVTMYEALDSSPPIPIPEPWYLALAVIIAAMLALVWSNRS